MLNPIQSVEKTNRNMVPVQLHKRWCALSTTEVCTLRRSVSRCPDFHGDKGALSELNVMINFGDALIFDESASIHSPPAQTNSGPFIVLGSLLER